MKHCSKCDTDKPVDQFNFKNKKKGIRYHQCRICWSAENKERYRQNKQYYIDKASKRKQRIKEGVVRCVVDYLKEHPCVDCGETDPIVLSFDHLRDKKHNIASMISVGHKWEAVEKEIQKCEVRCMNCHTRKTAEEQNFVILKILKE